MRGKPRPRFAPLVGVGADVEKAKLGFERGEIVALAVVGVDVLEDVCEDAGVLGSKFGGHLADGKGVILEEAVVKAADWLLASRLGRAAAEPDHVRVEHGVGRGVEKESVEGRNGPGVFAAGPAAVLGKGDVGEDEANESVGVAGSGEDNVRFQKAVGGEGLVEGPRVQGEPEFPRGRLLERGPRSVNLRPKCHKVEKVGNVDVSDALKDEGLEIGGERRPATRSVVGLHDDCAGAERLDGTRLSGTCGRENF